MALGRPALRIAQQFSSHRSIGILAMDTTLPLLLLMRWDRFLQEMSCSLSSRWPDQTGIKILKANLALFRQSGMRRFTMRLSPPLVTAFMLSRRGPTAARILTIPFMVRATGVIIR